MDLDATPNTLSLGTAKLKHGEQSLWQDIVLRLSACKFFSRQWGDHSAI
jgi:hypothetical protein